MILDEVMLKIGYFNILLTAVFSIIPRIFQWMGMDWMTYNANTQGYNIANAANSMINQTNGLDATISMFAIPIQLLGIIFDFIKNMMLANYDIIVGIMQVPVELWGIYAIIYYILVIRVIYYVVTGK